MVHEQMATSCISRYVKMENLGFEGEEILAQTAYYVKERGKMTTENTKPLIQIRNLTKSYSQTTALKNVDLDLIPGQIIGLLGPNGDGKTTLIKNYERFASGLQRRDADRWSQAGRLYQEYYFLSAGRKLFQRLDEKPATR